MPAAGPNQPLEVKEEDEKPHSMASFSGDRDQPGAGPGPLRVAFAQDSVGNVYGRVTDDKGEKLPGVTITLAGPGAEKLQVTDGSGEFRFLGLDPGNYKIEASLEGFGTVVYEAVNVRIGRNTTIELAMNPAIEETITVTTESPLLDERKITNGIQVTALELEKIPTAKDPWAVAGQTPAC